MAAEAGSQQLPAQRLAQILSSGGKGVKVNRETADYVANVWVDYALFGQAVVHGKLPLDSASVADAVWPEISELKGTHWHDTLMAHRGSVTDAAVDSLYGRPTPGCSSTSCSVPGPNIDSTQRTAVKKKAEATLAQIRKGANFDQLAAQLSEDPGSKADSGYLPPSPKGRFVPAFDSAGWALQPGQVSGLVETPFGYHIIKRPTGTEARGHIVDYLQERAGEHLDSLYMDSLAAANKIEVLPARRRPCGPRPRRSDESRKSGQGAGEVHRAATLTVKEFLRWVRALPPQYSQQLREANDTHADQFARILTQNVLLLREADRNKIAITPARVGRRSSAATRASSTRSGSRWGCRTGTSPTPPWRSASGRRWRGSRSSGTSTISSPASPASGRCPPPSPRCSASACRTRVHEAGVNRAVELAVELKAKADSAAPKGAMQRAPGPPPVPGMQPAPGRPLRRRPPRLGSRAGGPHAGARRRPAQGARLPERSSHDPARAGAVLVLLLGLAGRRR